MHMLEKLMSDYFEKTVGEKVVSVIELTFGRARITIGNVGSQFYDDGW
jgi:hypothetical protein